MILLYTLSIRLYYLSIRIAALWNKKARAWIEGRNDWFEALEKKIAPGDKIIWMHCSSAGEFEQGKPVIEQLKEKYPVYKILVSFFSPSGYAVAKNYQHADAITYLPLDTNQNARRFIELVNPSLIIFVKYEFWYHHLSAAAFKHIPLLLISAVFRKEQLFFKRYGKFYRHLLFLFRHIFVQDESSLQLLQQAGIAHCSMGGDTRFDRVQEIAERFTMLPAIEKFTGGANALVAGSTWSGDEQLLSNCKLQKLIIAPHEINEAHLTQIEKLFKNCIRYSQFQNADGTEQVLLIDNVGMLSRLYKYAAITYVGGGFTKDGIHNILEAAVYGKPVIFGPNYEKYREAKELIGVGGAFSVASAEELNNRLNSLLNDAAQCKAAGIKAQDYVQENTGATQKIIQLIQEKRLLTS